MSIDELRNQIDSLDDEITKAYIKRLAIVKNVGEEKRSGGSNVLDIERENNILQRLTNNVDSKTASYIKELYSVIFETGRKVQSEYINFTLFDEIKKIVQSAPITFPKKMKTACQGAKGAFSYIAANKLFKDPEISYFNTFEEVFRAVEKGECECGILPIENSTAGSVNEIYDLMRRYKLYVIRSAKIKVEHNLLANRGAKLSDIKEVYSNEQAIAQCSNFLKQNNIKGIFTENTASSVIYVKESERKDIGAIASKICSSLYGMDNLKSDIQNKENNYTRFICISKKLIVFSGADRLSIMVSLPHTNGSLLNFLKKFASYNMTKLESRPAPDTEYAYTFYFDFEVNLKNSGILDLLCELTNSAYDITFVGAYSEITDLPEEDNVNELF